MLDVTTAEQENDPEKYQSSNRKVRKIIGNYSVSRVKMEVHATVTCEKNVHTYTHTQSNSTVQIEKNRYDIRLVENYT